MIKKIAVFLCIVFIGIFATSSFESNISDMEKPADHAVLEEKSETFFANRNYLLPLEKILLPIKKNDVSDIDLTAKTVLVIDNASEEVIYGKDAEKRLPIASLTKLATALTILELSDRNIYDDLSERKIYNLNKSVVLSKSSIDQEGNSGTLKEAEVIKADDLMKAMLVASSNDAAWALAEDVAGTMKEGGEVSDFIQLMNDLAVKEKLKETHFSNPTGIDDKENYSSATDVLRIMQRLQRYYPDTFALTKTKSIDIKSSDGIETHHLANTDKLLGKMEGIMGGKTGFTDESGESLVLIVKNPKTGIIISTAIIGSKDRFGEMEKLVNWVWNSYEWK